MALGATSSDPPSAGRHVRTAEMSAGYNRWLRAIETFNDWDGGDIVDLCIACAVLFPDSEVGILLVGADETPAAWYSSGIRYEIERLQVTLGIGPALEAYHTGQPVLESDL